MSEPLGDEMRGQITVRIPKTGSEEVIYEGDVIAQDLNKLIRGRRLQRAYLAYRKRRKKNV
jgi:hypothetical protein